jgi:hypothetical protein
MRHLDVTHLDPFPGCASAADNIRMDPRGFNTNLRLRASDADRDRAVPVFGGLSITVRRRCGWSTQM